MKEPIYGYPCVDDPNDFEPDRECCTDAEIAAWERAKLTFGTPEFVPNAGCYSVHDDSGREVAHVTRTSWGIGVNYVEV